MKSRKIYDFAYERFYKWAEEQKIYTYSEDVILSYFVHLSKTMRNSSLWAQYSMIKAELNFKHNVRMEGYKKISMFLKQHGEGYKPKKSRIFSKDQFESFLQSAPDPTYLSTKVILMFGILGACRCEELIQITIDDIEDFDKFVRIKITKSRNDQSRYFELLDDHHIALYKKYAALRPKDMNSPRFFIKYQNGRCHRIVIGIHKIASVPRDVAKYLGLPDPKEYTGFCFRRTSENIFYNNRGPSRFRRY